ncbi:MAG: hypothetical protein OEX81_04110 [Candidatus Pacebacteria bacterium]|nr:hypothetical protein [Candidatus Paceibacterota bacterium]
MVVEHVERLISSPKIYVCSVCGGDHHIRYHRSSNGFKFDGEVRHQARDLAGNCCIICRKENSYDVHHFLAIWAYKVISQESVFNDLNKSILTSVHNALIVCQDCHDDLHYKDCLAIGDKEKESERLVYYRWAANVLLNLYHGDGYKRE